MPKYCLSLSGGKDSTALLLYILDRGLPLDIVRFFDEEEWSFPGIREHVDKLEKYTGIPIERVTGKHSLEWYFYNGNSKVSPTGKGYSWPTYCYRWCNSVKVDALQKGLEKGDFVYIGINYEERKRVNHESHHRKTCNLYPLVDAKFGEDDVRGLCASHGFTWDSMYLFFTRTSCFCCPLTPVPALRTLFRYFPEYWKKLILMEARTYRTFKSHGMLRGLYTVYYYHTKFYNFFKEAGLSIPYESAEAIQCLDAPLTPVEKLPPYVVKTVPPLRSL